MLLLLPAHYNIKSPPPSPSPPSKNPTLPHPRPQLKTPTPRHQHPTHHIHQPYQQRQQTPIAGADDQQDGLDVVFEEDARDGVAGDFAGLRGRGVLVREDAAVVAFLLFGGEDGDVGYLAVVAAVFGG